MSDSIYSSFEKAISRKLKDDVIIHVREVSPEREAAIEKMVEALKDANMFACVVRRRENASDAVGVVLKTDEALEAWREVNNVVK